MCLMYLEKSSFLSGHYAMLYWTKSTHDGIFQMEIIQFVKIELSQITNLSISKKMAD